MYTHGQQQQQQQHNTNIKIDPHPKRKTTRSRDNMKKSDDDGNNNNNSSSNNNNHEGKNTNESPDVKALTYTNADLVTQNVQDGLRIEGMNSTPPGTYTSVTKNENGTSVVELKCTDNDSIQGDGIYIWVAHGEGNSNNHIEVEVVKSEGDGIHIYVAQGSENQNNTIKIRQVEALDGNSTDIDESDP